MLYALDTDWQAFARAAGADPVASSSGDRRLQRISFRGNSVTAVKMGSGCSETAVSAACVLATIPFDLFITVGPAGDLKDRWTQGTLVVIDHLFPWQTGRNTAVALPLPATAATRVPGKPAQWALVGAGIFPGAVCASGEQFVQTGEQRRELAVAADIVDMNTFGAETAAAAWKVPCLHLRVVSDHADENAREDFLQFVKSWDGRAGLAAFKVVSALKPDPTRPGSYESLRKLIPDGGAPQTGHDPAKGE